MIIISDFDGTITNRDTLDVIIDYYHGKDTIKQFEDRVLKGYDTHNNFYKFFDNIKIDICNFIEILKSNGVYADPEFKNFYDEVKDKNRFFILSSGVKEIINCFVDNINVISNSLKNINYNFSKVEEIKKIKTKFPNEPIIYIGDGLSDIKVIPYVDILFSKHNSFLHKYCNNNNIETYSFYNFKDLCVKIFKHKIHYNLFSPGVVRASEKTLDEFGTQHTFMHRHDEFHDLYKEINYKLTNLVSNTKDYISMFVTGSGTTSMDEVINSLIHKKTLFLSNGMFGERWISIAKFYNFINTYEYKLEWGQQYNLDEILKIIKNKNIECVVMVHCDTSVGILNPIDICKDIKLQNNNVTTVVDAVSTFGAIPINVDIGIDILVTNPNKALESLMGIGIIICKHAVVEKLNESNAYSYSLNLKRHYNYSLNYETCNTVSIASLKALHKSLEMKFTSKRDILSNYENYKSIYDMFYRGIKYKKLLPYDLSSPCIITILLPNCNELIKYLKSQLYIVYECKGKYLNKGFQISFYNHTIKNKKPLNKLIDYINKF